MRGVRIYRRRLPHWRLDGASYFVTWRLQRGQAPLSPDERTAVFRIIRHFDGVRFRLHALVVMDDHVHIIVTSWLGRQLEGIVRGWKTFSARRLTEGNRRAPVWQREYHDRIIRTPKALMEILNYVRLNPVRRWPGLAEYPWLWIGPSVGADQ